MTISDNIITSISNEKMKRVRALAQKKNRDAEKVYVVEGVEHLQKALKNGWTVETLICQENAVNSPDMQQIFSNCKAQKAAVFIVNNKVASYVTNRDNAQNVIAVLKQKFAPIAEVAGFWLGLENIRDPGNLGSIIRTAEAAGAHGILLIGNCCDAFSPEVIRASTGSFSSMPLVQISATEFLNWRKNYTGKIVGTHLHDKSVDYREVRISPPSILLMGGEQNGLSSELTDACDVLAKIPMRDGVESLNLAVSTGIMLYSMSEF